MDLSATSTRSRPEGEQSSGPERPPFTADDLSAQVVPGQVTVRADRVVYTLRQVDDRGERTDLWTVPYDGGAPVRLTRSPGTDHTPRIAPDGISLAFLRSTSEEPAQLLLLDLHTGSLRILGHAARGAHDLDWGPDGTWLVALVEDETSRSVVPSTTAATAPADGEDAGTLSPTALVLTRVDWRGDGEADGGLRLHPRHLHRVCTRTGRRTRLTRGDWSASRPRVRADGRVLFLADRSARADRHPAPQVCWLEEPDGRCLEVTAFPGGVTRFHMGDGGLRVLAHERPDPRDHEPPGLYDVVPKGAARRVRGHDGRWLGLLGEESDLHEWGLDLDDCAALGAHSTDGSSVPVDLDTARPLVEPPVLCGALAEDAGRRVGVLALGRGAVAPDLYALEKAGPRRLTHHGAWLERFAAPRPEQRVVSGPAGEITVQLLRPPDEHGVAPAATVVALHGGPTSQWGVVPTVEALVLAGAGYLVAMPNVRGSLDRGPSWVQPLEGAWGRVDAEDVHAVCDDLVATGLADPDRLGVAGLSYGGFLTQWLIGGTDRFAAAVSANGVANQVSAWAGCDTGPAYCRAAGLGDTLSPAGVEKLWTAPPWRGSPTSRLRC